MPASGVQLACSARCTSAFGASEASEAGVWASPKAAAMEGVARLCRAMASGAVAGFGSDVQQRSLSGLGPLSAMDEPELACWQRLLSVRLEVGGVARHTNGADVPAAADKLDPIPAHGPAQQDGTAARHSSAAYGSGGSRAGPAGP